jgi:type IV pilus assembly protein PilX
MKANPTRWLRRRSPRGASLIFALLAVLLLSLAAAGLVRTVGTGSLAVGNLGFKREATAAADRGAELAIAWLQANASGATLDNDAAASGYYATAKQALDPTGRNTSASTRVVVDWDGDNCAGVSGAYTACIDPTAANTVGSNQVRWLITRLCAANGDKDAVGNSCATSVGGSADDTNSGSIDYSNRGGLVSATTNPYYRIVVRAVGARNTTSVIETIVHF